MSVTVSTLSHKPSQAEALKRLLVGLGLCAIAVSLAGCGGEAEAKLDDYLLELEFETPLESTSELEIGTYLTTVAARQQTVSGAETEPQWMQIRFKMYAVVDPGNVSVVESEIARHQGLLDDTIMLVCRNASVDELADNRWAILKSRIIDNIRPILGEDRLRQLLIVDNICEPI